MKETEIEEQIDYKWKLAVFILAICLVISFFIIIEGKNQINNYQENYVYGCSEGMENKCLKPDQEISYCEDDEFCYNSQLQSMTLCNKVDREYATCVSTDPSRWTTCSEGYSATCIDEDRDYVSCNQGYDAECFDKDKWAVWTGTYSYACSVGQTARCVTD
jgi:hypothetical protein